MFEHHTAAENLYLKSPLLSSSSELLVITLADLILRQNVVVANRQLLRVDNRPTMSPLHVSAIIDNLEGKELHFTHLLKAVMDSISKTEFKESIIGLVATNGFVRSKCLRTAKGRRERNDQRRQLTLYSNDILNRDKSQIIDIVHRIGGNLYLLDRKPTQIIHNSFPYPFTVKNLITRSFNALHASCKNRDYYGGWLRDPFSMMQLSLSDSDYSGNESHDGFDFGGGDFGGGGGGSDY